MYHTFTNLFLVPVLINVMQIFFSGSNVNVVCIWHVCCLICVWTYLISHIKEMKCVQWQRPSPTSTFPIQEGLAKYYANEWFAVNRIIYKLIHSYIIQLLCHPWGNSMHLQNDDGRFYIHALVKAVLLLLPD